MESHSSLLLALYRGARVMPTPEFAQFALDLMKKTIRFEKARYTTVAIAADSKRTMVQTVLLHNEPDNMVLDWTAIMRQDKVLHAVRDNVGRTLNYHATTLFAGAETALMRDYARRYEHRNGLVLMLHEPVSGLYDALALYRVGERDHFSKGEQTLMQQLSPHVQEALRINVQLESDAQPRGDLAIAHFDGTVHFCGAAFQALMQMEWPDWRAQRLPAELMVALASPGGAYAGRHVLVKCSTREHSVYLRAQRHVKSSRLSPRELEVARHYASGLSFKEVARQMGLAPSTVRNFLQKVYQKLEVCDKAQLANALAIGAAPLQRPPARSGSRP